MSLMIEWRLCVMDLSCYWQKKDNTKTSGVDSNNNGAKWMEFGSSDVREDGEHNFGFVMMSKILPTWDDFFSQI